jgi:GNAT superfamily N-acetyltransferase
MSELTIMLFQPGDREEVRNLILAGLAEHWGKLDPAKNPDLEKIGSAYTGATTLVARVGGRIVGTGTLVPRTKETAEIVRMSVTADVRRRGIGGMILLQLIEHARAGGFQQVVLETTATWQDVIAFYQRHGFAITHYQAGDVYFALDLTTSSSVRHQ